MKHLFGMKLMGGTLALAGALLTNTTPVMAQDYGYPQGYNNAPAGQPDSLVSRIALYPDELLAQIFAAAAYPDQIAAAAQGAGGPFDPSVEALRQYPSVLQMMASDPGWTQALGEAVMQDQGAVMDQIQNLRREAQQYGYLQSGPQMQVVDDGGYIGIQPVGGYMYVPTYDPYVVFARPRPGFFVGGAIHFGGGFRWTSGYNRFNWRSHQVVVNRRVWTPPAHRVFEQRRFDDNRRNFTGGNRDWNRNQVPAQRNFTREQQGRDFGRQFGQQNRTAPQPPQRSFTQEQPRRDFGRQFGQQNRVAPQPQSQQRNFTREQPRRDAGRQMEQRNFAAPQQQQQRQQPQQERSFTPRPRNEGGHVERGGGGHGHGRGR